MDLLLSQLVRYSEKFPEEQTIVDEFIKFLKENPENCVSREAYTPGHLTASAFVVNFDKSKILMTHHKKLNMWLQLGGHVDGDINVRAVAIKEAQEESGIDDFEVLLDGEIFDIGIRPIPEFKGIPFHSHFDIVYVLQVKSTEKYIVSEESHDLQWKDIKSLTGISQSVIKMQEKYIKLLNL